MPRNINFVFYFIYCSQILFLKRVWSFLQRLHTDFHRNFGKKLHFICCNYSKNLPIIDLIGFWFIIMVAIVIYIQFERIINLFSITILLFMFLIIKKLFLNLFMKSSSFLFWKNTIFVFFLFYNIQWKRKVKVAVSNNWYYVPTIKLCTINFWTFIKIIKWYKCREYAR
jgi:hypothetical protein